MGYYRAVRQEVLSDTSLGVHAFRLLMWMTGQRIGYDLPSPKQTMDLFRWDAETAKMAVRELWQGGYLDHAPGDDDGEPWRLNYEKVLTTWPGRA
jgi:hypothetical protein